LSGFLLVARTGGCEQNQFKDASNLALLTGVLGLLNPIVYLATFGSLFKDVPSGPSPSSFTPDWCFFVDFLLVGCVGMYNYYIVRGLRRLAVSQLLELTPDTGSGGASPTTSYSKPLSSSVGPPSPAENRREGVVRG